MSEKTFYAILLGVMVGLVAATSINHKTPTKTEKNLSPVVETPTPTLTPTPQPTKRIEYKGTASYYSRAGCLGCSPNMTMANGQPLNDDALTVAYNRAPLGSYIEVKNEKTGKAVVAQVTDTGGFESLGRIVDLTLAVKNAIECSSLCQVQITHL